MDEQINFGISGDVSIKGTNSIKDLNTEFSKVLETVQALKKSTTEANDALKSTSVKKLVSDTDINNMLSSLDGMFKKVESISNKTFDQLSLNIESSLSKSFESAFKKYEELAQKAANGTLGKASGHGLLAKANRANSDSISEDIYERLYGESNTYSPKLSKLSRKESSSVSRFARKYQEQIAGHKLSNNISAFDTGVVDEYQAMELKLKKQYVRDVQQLYNERIRILKEQNQYLLTESAGIKDFRTNLGQKDWKSFSSDNRRYYEGVKSDFYAERTLRQVNEEHERRASISSGLLLTADAGKSKEAEEKLANIIEGTIDAEERIRQAKEEEARAAEENAEKEKKSNKIKGMTEYQSEKIRVEDEHNKIRAERAATEAAAEARKNARDNSGYNEYRNAHPELFAVGALYHSKRYQTGHAFQSLGGVASTLGSGGRAVGLALDSLGAFFKAVPLGVATTISNLAKGITELGKAAVQAYAEIESIKTQLGVVFSNQTQADAMFGQISQYAVKSPFGVQQTSELAVLLKQSGVYASDLMDTLKMLGDTAGGNMEKMKRIANNYAQIVSIGKASMLDMRQFAYAGIPIFEAVSKELGVSQQELRKLISDGKVTADIVEKVFKDLTGINGIFENATEKGAQTLKARLQNLSDAKQLALGALGERVVNAGTQYGNDGFMLKFVSTAESFFNWMKEHNDIRNIERDVNTIATSDKRITDLQAMLQYAKDTGDENAVKMIEAAIKAQRTLFDPDKIRAILSESYDQKTGGLTQLQSQYGLMTEEEARAAKAQYELNKLETKLSQPLSPSQEEKDRIDTQEAMWQKLSDDMDAYIAAIQKATTVTEEETKAHREVVLINKQQSAFDQAQKEAGKEGSYSAAFDKLYSLETQSEEYKKKKQDEEIKFLKEAQEALKKLADFVDEQGNLDMTKLGYSEFSALYNDKHAFDPSKKLTITEGKSEAQMTSDRAILEKQWNDMSDKIAKELSEKGQNLAVNRMGIARRMYSMEGGDNKTYFANFDLLLNHQLSILEELAKENAGTDDEKYYQDMYNNLLASTFQLGVNKKGLNANPDDLLQGAKNEFIPLWKRIMAQYTGLSTTEMTSAQDTLERYRDDMSVRNMASGVASAMMKSGNYNSALKLFAAGNAQQLKEDSSATLQVDWKTTRQNMKDFALSLSATTDVVDAYKKGLEDELDTYQQLIIAGRTQGEDQNGGTNQFISVKKLAQFAQTNAQLVNAFGDELVTKNGTYKVSDIEVRKNENDETELYYLGNKIEDQIMVTDTLTRFLEKELPRLQEEIAEANIHSAMLVEIERLQAERRVSRASIVSQSAILTGNLKSSNIDSASILSTKTTNQTGYLINQKVGEAFENIFKKIAEMDPIDLVNPDDIKDEKERYAAIEASKEIGLYGKTDDEKSQALIVLRNLQTVFNNGDIKGITTLTYALQKFFEAFPDASKKIVEESEKTVKATQEDELIKVADELLKNSPLSIGDALKKDRDFTNNSIFEQGIMEALGLSRRNFSDLNTKITDNILENPSENTELTDKYTKGILSSLKKEGKEGNLSPEEVEEYSSKISKLAESEDFKEIKNFLTNHEMGNIWDKVTESTNKWALSLGNIGKTLNDISKHTEDMVNDFASNAISSSMSLWGETLATSADDSDKIVKNLAQLSANMMSDLGSYLVKAGLTLAISSIGDKAGVMAGLAIAAAGGGMSFLGGYLNGMINNDKDDNKENKELERLLQVKQDLADLLKQAREDSIYYENTLRHKKAISANDEFTSRSVHDAIITPRGDIVTTDPKDYLIATKTPKTLVGGGAPTINFNVVDKSTGIKVTQQKSTYNESTNTIEFEAIIESKVQEVIASAKGDEAFAARQARLNGRTVIA